MGLDLDERQRAMLQEMHVKVWWPQALAPAVVADMPAARTSTAPATVPAVAARLPVGDVPIAGREQTTNGGAAPSPADIGVMDWPALASTISGCGACKLCVGRKAAVFSAEPAARQADWLLVGEPPGEEEERAGQPFAAQAGELLDNMLRAIQISRVGVGRAGARLTNVVKCRPAVVRIPEADELASCAVYLRREIALVQPRVILAMGRFAAWSMLGASHPELAGLPFGKLRGQVYQYQDVPVVVTYHPSKLLRAPQDKALAWADLCLARDVARQQA